MPKKIFTLETLAAKHGDCLLLHWGDSNDPGLMVIDGGPSGVYNAFLKKRLDQLRRTRQDPLAIDLVMVSHIDDDHVRGILDLTKQIEDAQLQGRAEPYEIDEIWFNAFDDIVGNRPAAAFTASVAGNFSPEHWHAAAVVASVGQGRTLRDRARRLAIRKNGGDALITDGWEWDMGQGLTFHVIGPRKKRIDEFQKAWDKEVKRNGWAARSDVARVVAYLDDSPYNLASTVILAKFGSKTMLLTGDARGDDILKGLREADLLTGNSMKVDILKVPHHGSDNNVETGFFRRVRADHYVISGDGKHHNPEITVLEMIREARGRAAYKVHMTYRTTIDGHKQALDRFLNKLSKSERRKFVFRPDDALSFKLNLGKTLSD